jgi:hypothetical protein
MASPDRPLTQESIHPQLTSATRSAIVLHCGLGTDVSDHGDRDMCGLHDPVQALSSDRPNAAREVPHLRRPPLSGKCLAEPGWFLPTRWVTPVHRDNRRWAYGGVAAGRAWRHQWCSDLLRGRGAARSADSRTSPMPARDVIRDHRLMHQRQRHTAGSRQRDSCRRRWVSTRADLPHHSRALARDGGRYR